MKIKNNEIVFTKKEISGIKKVMKKTKDMPENFVTWDIRAERIFKIIKLIK